MNSFYGLLKDSLTDTNNMLTIDNLNRIGDCLGFDTYIKTASTHYTFLINVNGTLIEVILARHKPILKNGKPHPHRDKYLLQCGHNSWKHYWLTTDNIKDIWEMTRLIESFIN